MGPMHHPGHHEYKNCSNISHVDWPWDIFHECVVDNLQYAGFILGLVSILCWVFVFIPQFIESFRKGNLDTAVSPFFLLCWLAGDLSNLIGAILTHQLGTQIATAYYYIVMDVLIFMQYLYYVIKNSRKRRRLLIDENGETKPNYNTIPSRTDTNHAAIYCVGGLFICSYIMSTQFESPRISAPESHSVGRSLLAIPSTMSGTDEGNACYIEFGSTGDCLFKDQSELIGYCIGSLSGLFYVGSRLPQIIKNFKRKSVEGLSPFMFLLAVLGNTFYGLSILLVDTQLVFIVAHIPWLVGSMGCLTFDFCLLIQFAVYGRNRSSKEDDEERRRLLTSNTLSPNSINSNAIYS